MANVNEIKQKTSCIEYAQNVLRLPVRVSGDRCRSLSPGSKNPTSLVVYADWWYDFKLCMGGDVIDLCAIAQHNGDRGKAIRELGGENQKWREYTQNLCNGVALWHKQLRSADWQYLYRRGIKKDTIERLMIGYKDGRLVIPYWKNGYVCYYITRDREEEPNIHTPMNVMGEESNEWSEPSTEVQENKKEFRKYKKDKLDGFNENVPWGLHTLDREHDFIVIAEGVFDAISFDQEGYKVLSPMGGHFGKTAHRQAIDICKSVAKVYVCFDNDERGSEFQIKMAQELFQNNIQFFCATTSEKDVSDYYAAGGELQALIDSARDGLEMLCERILDKEVFKSFVFKAARCVGKPEMAVLFGKVRELDRFDKTWLKMLEKQALAPPTEDLIADEILSTHRLKYFSALGFYEFSYGAWRRRADEEITRYIDSALGHYSTGGRLSAIIKIVKSRAVTSDIFDRLPVFNFLNGTLDLASGELKEHNENFLCSMQTDYNYDSNEWSQRWDGFIGEVCAGDERKMCLLQEIAGYVLFSDNRLQKCFFLLGDGANGKSVFLDVLSSVFGHAHVSNVEISGLIEPFQRIRLLNSILNISSETQSNVKGSESVFKQLVVGDTVSGCYKNKDFIEFQTRAKFVSACNEYIKSRDASIGFSRRISLVSFNARFVDEPEEGEYKADRTLTTTLNKDLPGIFNWCYQGYRILMEQGVFTETSEQSEMAKDFMYMTNPVAAFFDEVDLYPAKWSREQLYTKYKEWCSEAGHEPLSRTSFVRRFRTTIKQLKRKDIAEYKTSLERGFEIGA